MIVDYADFQEYANKLPEEYEEKVLNKLGDKPKDKRKVENLVREFYLREEGLSTDISWCGISRINDNLTEDATHYQSYDVLKGMFFMKTFYEDIGETMKYRTNRVLDLFRTTKDKNDILFDIFTEVMGVIEYNEMVDGKKKIILVEKLS